MYCRVRLFETVKVPVSTRAHETGWQQANMHDMAASTRHTLASFEVPMYRQMAYSKSNCGNYKVHWTPKLLSQALYKP